MTNVVIECPDCMGSGSSIWGQVCPGCSGMGRLRVSKWENDGERTLIERLELAEESEARGFMAEPPLVRLMIDTLRWYADEDNYDPESGAPGQWENVACAPCDPDEWDFEPDNGERARAALAALERSDDQ